MEKQDSHNGFSTSAADRDVGDVSFCIRDGKIDFFSDSVQDSEKLQMYMRYASIVGEIAAAAGTEPPSIIVKEDDDGMRIRFMLRRSGRMHPVLVVTENLLENSSDREIRAAVAHEFGHINSNIPIYRFTYAVNSAMLKSVVYGMKLTDYAMELIEKAIIPIRRLNESMADSYSIKITRDPGGSILSLLNETNCNFGSKRSMERLRKRTNELEELLPDIDWEKRLFAMAEPNSIFNAAISFFTYRHPPLSKRISVILDAAEKLGIESRPNQ